MGYCARVDGSCKRCEGDLPFDFTMAFQPIVDVSLARVVTHEALVRGINGESAWSVLSKVTDDLLYRFDQACRVKAIEMASELDMQTDLSINFLPNAVYEPEACIQATLEVSQRVGWPMDRLIFEITETERVRDRQHLRNIIEAYREMGFKTALDDFGNGYANLDLLTDLTPDILKIDRELVMNCDQEPRRQALLNAIISLAKALNTALIAEGVETRAEALWLAHAGITRQQGFFFAKPAINCLSPDLTPLLLDLREEVCVGLEATSY
ncbi:EAL domain-containing protein [Vreelandella andesensis]|uniref:EAL domain-containing protein n=1 Tax=Vreelandella andesensis TaxID=447567 RepID=A0A3S0W6M5_9GAMM|nr:EAL domain-containing protein [Halomonas andesensis]RUR29667.1 EAL domain-containing protein [Halomonas andesensis]